MTTDENQISEREREILQLVATGATNQEIAQRLSITVNTVKVHLRNIYGKINVVSRSEATVYAVRAGIVDIGRPIESANALPIQPAAPLAPPEEIEAEAGSSESQPVVPAVTAIQEDPPLIGVAPTPVEPDKIDQTELPPDTRIPARSARPAPPERTHPLTTVHPALLVTGALIALLLAGAVGAILARSPLNQANPEPTANTTAFPPANERSRPIAKLPVGLSGFALSLFTFDGKSYLYAIAGQTNQGLNSQVWRYDIATDVWVSFSAKPTAVTDVQTVVVGNRLFIPGGEMEDGSITSIFEAYDPQQDKWVRLSNLPAPRSRYGLAAIEGKIYLFGGWDGTNHHDDVWQYNPDTDTWVEQSPMIEARSELGIAVVDGQIYLLGGRNSSGKLNLVQVFQPIEASSGGNPWAIRAPLPEARSNLGAASIGGLIFVFGGADNTSGTLIYDPQIDAWRSQSTPLDATLYNLRVVASNREAFIVGGRNATQVTSDAFVYKAIYSTVLPFGN